MEILKYTLMSLLVTCLSVAAADPLKQKPQTLNSSPAKNSQQQVANELKPDFVPIYLYARENSLDGDYNFKYETGNGIFAEERGVMLNKGTENEANSVVGSYKYVSPEGVPIEVTYTAGVEGFRAYGAHLPVSPPAASNLPKNLAFKNVAQTTAFARPQFKTLNSDSSIEGRQVFLEEQGKTVSEQPLVRSEQSQLQSEQPQVPPSIEQVGTGQAASDVAEQSQNVLFVGREPTEKPVETIVGASVATSDQPQGPPAGTTQDYYQQSRGQSVPELQPAYPGLQSRPAPQPSVMQRFEPPRSVAPSVVPVLQTVPQAVQTQPRVVPVLQRLVPGGYQPQQQQQQQQQMQLNQFNSRPMVQQPPFNQQQRPGPVRQFSIEPQQMWYVPNNQQGRFFQMPPMQRTLGPPKY
ncbi:uncharacterized protein LOC132931927 isoform X2 [Rhopalosiphum padi]|uniref:uncharacterized protein LOC132931927 isoform X2 n=1 Tax=Rhopalosiphum padi TaxID=40932 RepID=UPI00298E7DEC|nr:uncharacterized protein LOC132931927 isoform X2 [Rhopalosiphum padi]